MKIFPMPLKYLFLSLSLLCLFTSACKNNDDEVVMPPMEEEEEEEMDEYIRIELSLEETYGDEFFNLSNIGINSLTAGITTEDGGYVLLGSSSGDSIKIFKIDAYCNVQWLSTLAFTNFPFPEDIIPTNDNGYLVVGGHWNATSLPNDIFAVKVDAEGNEVWRKVYETVVDHRARTVQALDNGQFMIVGSSEPNNGSKNVLIYLIDENGEEITRKVEDIASSGLPSVIIPISPGHFWIVGTMQSAPSAEGIYIINIDQGGNILATKIIKDIVGIAGNLQYVKTEDGILLTSTGYDTPNQLARDIVLMKLNLEGEVLWSKNYGGPSVDYGNSIVKTPDGNFLLGGSHGNPDNGFNDVLLMKVDPEGNQLWSKTYGAQESDRGGLILPIATGGYLIIGEQSEIDTEDDWMFCLTVDEDGVPY